MSQPRTVVVTQTIMALVVLAPAVGFIAWLVSRTVDATTRRNIALLCAALAAVVILAARC